MPGFFRPMQKLKSDGHAVDVAIGVSDETKDFESNFLGADSTIFRMPWKISGIARYTSLLKSYRFLSRIIRQGSYDFLYGHGAMGAFGCGVARWHGLRAGLRIYGVHKYADEIQRLPKWKFACKYPLQYYAFQGKKEFLVVTNDGSRGNCLQERICSGPAPYQFRFLRNGYDFEDESVKNNLSKSPFLFCPGRIAPKKRQHLCIEMLSYLHRAGHKEIRLVLAGHTSDQSYLEYLYQLAGELRVLNSVEYAGIYDKEQMLSAFRNCLGVLSFQKVSNFSNVCIEALAAGAVVVASDDGSLDELVVDGKSVILAKDSKIAAQRFACFVDGTRNLSEIGEEAKSAVRQKLRSWDDRVAEEVELIYDSSTISKAA